jgi:L,D-transpeptidase YcbB
MMHNRRRIRLDRALVFGLAVLVLTGGCKKKRWSEEQGEVDRSWSPAPAAVRGIPAEALHTAIEGQLASARPSRVNAEQWKRVQDLYRTYGNVPLWLSPTGPTDRSKALVSELAKAPTHALRLSNFPLDDLRQALQRVYSRDSATAEELATADVLLSATYVTLAHDLLSGQLDPRSESQDWHIDPRRVDVDSALAERIHFEPLDRAIAQLRPADEEYDALREQLERYRDLVSKGGWQAVPTGKKLAPGEKADSARLAALANRLRAEGYLDQEAQVEQQGDTGRVAHRFIYSKAIAGAVAEFQARHGIVVDSILGDETVASLNVPVDYRLGQIAANLERFRWLPRHLGPRYVLVNVPAFRLLAHDSSESDLEMKVIVGAEYENRRTPVFTDSMQFVVFRPYWNVTDQIAEKEVWPKANADPTYLERNNYETFNDHGVTRIRQRPGGKNSLGLVKFLFPNDFNVYLHDTPQDELFEKDVRDFSHGCIRLEKPDELAEWVLRWPYDRVETAMHSGPDNRTVTLPRKIPVYIVYFTTYMRDGQLYFGNDLYSRDDAMVRDVADGAEPSAQDLATLEELKRLAGVSASS